MVQRDEISKLEEKIAGMSCELDILHTEKLDTTSALKNLEESFLVVDESSKIFQQKESEATAQISELIAELFKVKADHKKLTEEKMELQDHYNARQKKYTDLTLELDARVVEVGDKSVIVDSLKVALLELKSQISNLKTSNSQNLEQLANVQGEMIELKASLVAAEKKIADDEESRRVELDETIQQIRDDEQDRALDSEAEVTEHYKKREGSLKKQFVDFQADANRKVRLAEKRVAMFKNMYNKIKNEKLELVPIGNEKYLFLSEKDTLNLSQMSDVKPDAQEAYLDSHADYLQVEALITEISILKKNVEQAELAKSRLMDSNLATHEIQTLRAEILDLHRQLKSLSSD
jgi:chromosome segregation ATPase